MVGRCRYSTACVIVGLAALLVASSASASVLVSQLTLSADRLRVDADGKSSVAVTIEAIGPTGMPVPDGTDVYLVTTLGEIVSPVQIVGGFAQTVFTTSTEAGTALVSAMVGAARSTLEIECVAGPGSATPGSRMVELSAEELSYLPDTRTFVAGPSALLTFETIEIRADGMEYDVVANEVRAQGSVVLRSGAAEVKAEALRYDLSTLRGKLLRVSDQPERLLVEGGKLQTRPDPSDDPGLWYDVPQGECRTSVKARSAVIRPRQQVILDHAAVYVDDLRVMGMRRHVMDPRRGSTLFGNAFGYSSLFGAAVDIPFYYAASGSRIGCLHFTHNRSVGGLGGDPGWGLGLKEEYFREGRSEGSLSVEDITHPARGVQWRQQLKLSAGSALSMDAGFSTFQRNDPSLRSAGLSYYRPMSSGRLSLTLSGSDFGTSENYFGTLGYRFGTSRIGSGVLITPSLNLRHSRRRSESHDVLVNPDTGETLEISQESSGRTTSPGFDVDIALPKRTVGRTLQFNASAHTGYAWGLEGGSRPVVDGQLGLVRQFSPGAYLRLQYTYSGAPASLQPTLFKIGRQRLSLNGRTKLRGCDLRFNASQEIGGGRMFGNLTLVRGLPWGTDPDGRPSWTLQATHVFSHLAAYKLASTQLALARRMGQYYLSVCYSPQGKGGFASQPWVSLDGYGYSYSGGKHLWIEVSSAGF